MASESVLNLIIRLKDEASAGIGQLGGALATVGGVATAGAIAGLAGIGAAAIGVGSDLQGVTNQLQAQLGATADEAAALGDVALEVFGGNFGESIADAGAAVGELQQRLGLLETEGAGALEEAAASAFALRDVFGVDVAESAAAAQTLMNEFGVSSAEAFNLLAAGFQQGLNGSDDFLDTIGEYSNLFADGGASVDQFFSTLQTGMAGGVLGTDKAADAFKEFGIRIQDGSTSTRDALASLGIEEVLTGIRDGSLSAADAFPIVQAALAGIADPIAQAQLGVALFGTQFEDLGASAVLGIDLARTNLDDLAGATDSLTVKYDTFGAFFSGLWREALVAIAPLGTALLDLANASLPVLQAGIERARPIIDGISAGLGGVTTAVEGIATALTSGDLAGAAAVLAESLRGIFAVGTNGDGNGGIAAFISGTIEQIAGAAPQVIAAAASWAAGIGQALRDGLPAATAALGGIISGIVGGIGAALPQIIAATQPYVQAFAQWVIDAAPVMLSQLGGLVAQILSAIGAALPGIVEAVAGWAAAFIAFAIDAAPGMLAALGGLIAQALGWIAAQLPGIAAQLGAWALAFIAWVGPTAADLIVMLGQLGGQLLGWIIQQAPAILSTVGEWAIALSGWVLAEALPTLLSSLGTLIDDVVGFIGNQVSSIAGAGARVGSGIVDGIKQGFRNAWGAVESWIASQIAKLPEPIQSALGIKSPSRVFAEQIGRPLAEGIAVGFTDGVPTITTALEDLGPALMRAAAVLPPQASGIGRDTAEGIGAGMREGIPSLTQAAHQVASVPVVAMQAALGIASASRVFADDVGEPIIAGMAQGMLANLQVLLDAAQDISWAVLDEAKAFAGTITDAVGPLLAAAYQGAADFARGQISGLDLLSGLVPDTSALDRLRDVDTSALDRLSAEYLKAQAAIDRSTAAIAEHDARLQDLGGQRAALESQLAGPIDLAARDRQRIDAERARLQAQLAGPQALSADEQARIDARRRALEARRAAPGLSDDQAARFDDELAALDEESARLEQAARDRLQTELTRLGEEETRLRDAARDRLETELERVIDEQTRLEAERTQAEQRHAADRAGLEANRQYWLERYQAAEREIQAKQAEVDAERARLAVVVAAQQQIATEAQRALTEAQQQALQFEDPAERAAFFNLRRQQIGEEAALRQQLAAATTDAERAALDERLDLLRQAHQAAFAAYEADARARRDAQAGALRDAEDAITQLGNLIFFSQEDLNGVGSETIRGIAAGMLANAAALSAALGGILDQVIADARRQLGISSPSRVAAERLGEPFVEGIAGELLAGRASLADAAGALLEAALITPPTLPAPSLPLPGLAPAPGLALATASGVGTGGNGAGTDQSIHIGDIYLNGSPASLDIRQQVQAGIDAALRETGRDAEVRRRMQGARRMPWRS